jgi:hypothetical protein
MAGRIVRVVIRIDCAFLRLGLIYHSTPVVQKRFFFAAAVLFAAMLYAAFGFAPSSYATFLKQLDASDSKPILGTARPTRTDEWALMTPLFQASVRNHFERYNKTSFYNEDLRNFYALPLRDWALIFRPQLWLFFMTPPATAYAFYWAFLFTVFLIGYDFLFRELGFSPLVAAAAALTLYFSGYSQFWWTTVGPLLGGLAWIAYLVLRPMRPLWKCIALTYTITWWALSHFYVPFLLELALTTLIVLVAFRPTALKSVALPIALIASAAIVYAYYRDIIPVMLATIYPGHRIAKPGLIHPASWISQFYPFVHFNLVDFEPLIAGNYRVQEDPTLWWNIYETSATGSFLPVLALCFLRYSALDRKLRRTLTVLLAAFLTMTIWEITPAPAILGRIFLWDRVFAQRLLFSSGLLLTFAGLVVWRRHLLSITPRRVALFIAAGPLAAVVLKRQIFHPDALMPDVWICSLLAATALATLVLPKEVRANALLLAVAAVNAYVFARFNPIQPARPIFNIPETEIIRDLRAAAEENGGVLVESHYLAATLNGLGFRSVSHTLMSPQLKLFREYFPTVPDDEFNSIFNRFAHVHAVDDPWPSARGSQEIRVPSEPFRIVQNLRDAVVEQPFPGACDAPVAGEIDRVTRQDNALILEGWARWRGEKSNQGVRVLTKRDVEATLVTTARPAAAAAIHDYRFDKAGFKLTLEPRDHRPVDSREVILFAFGTVGSGGLIRGAACR